MSAKYIRPEIFESIYGLKSRRNGEMLYVGKSIRPQVRASSHFCASGKLGHIPSDSTELVVFKRTSRDAAQALEKRLIRRYWAKGQCRYNKRCVSPKTIVGDTHIKLICPCLGLRFESRALAAVFFGLSIYKIRRALRTGKLKEPIRWRGRNVYLRRVRV